jgi:AhpD family alkylhydroperoxidase
MTRVRDVELEDLPEDVRTALAGRRKSYLGEATWEKAAGHCPEAVRHIADLMGSFGAHGTVSHRYIHIAVVTVSRLNECRHCVGRHSVRLSDQGLGHETIARILEPDCPGLDEVDRVVRDYAMLVSEKSTAIPDRMFDDLKAHFTEAEIVELTLRASLAGFFNRFNNAMQIDLDETHLTAFLAQSGSVEDLPEPPPGSSR